MKDILEKIRTTRVSKGYTQDYIAEKLGIDAVNYGRIERGQARLTLDRFLKICEILEIEPAEFFETGANYEIIEYLKKIYETEKLILKTLKSLKQ